MKPHNHHNKDTRAQPGESNSLKAMECNKNISDVPKQNFLQCQAPDSDNSNEKSVPGQINQLIQIILDMKAQLKIMEQKIDRACPPAGMPEGTISTKAAMQMLGYKDKKSFLAAASRHRLLHYRVNRRKFAWSPHAIETWKNERRFGKAPREPSSF